MLNILMLSVDLAELDGSFSKAPCSCVSPGNDTGLTFGPRAFHSLCLMVTMLVPRTEKIPLFTDFFGGKSPPILAKTRTFVVRKITPFF